MEPHREAPTRRGTGAGSFAIEEAAAPEGDEGADTYIGEPLDPDYLERLIQETD